MQFAAAEGDGPYRGQTAIVTGASRGIGREIALALAGEGMNLALVARSVEQLGEVKGAVETAGVRCRAFPMDVRDSDDVADAVARTESELGPVDLLVNDAAVISPIGPFWEVDQDEWWQLQEVNLRGPYLFMAAVVPAMVRRGHGRVVNVGSGVGSVAIAYASAYVVSKAALCRLSENAAVELQPHGISVFCIDPGPVRTEMTDYLTESEPAKRWAGWFAEEFAKADSSPQPGVGLVLQCASGKADALTGRFLTPQDDIEDLIRRADECEREQLYVLRLRRL